MCLAAYFGLPTKDATSERIVTYNIFFVRFLVFGAGWFLSDQNWLVSVLNPLVNLQNNIKLNVEKNQALKSCVVFIVLFFVGNHLALKRRRLLITTLFSQIYPGSSWNRREI